MSELHQTSRFRIGGMDCAACAAKIENALRPVPGVAGLSVSVASGTLTLTHSAALEGGAIDARLRPLGYTVLPLAQNAETPAFWRNPKAQLTAGCGLALLLAWISGQFLGVGDWAFAAALAIGLVPVLRRAIAAARTGTPFTIETLMSVAAVGAIFIGALEEAAAVVFLFLIGELLEGLAASRARASIRGLAALVPKTALVERNGTLGTVPAESLQPGAVFIVRPGERIAADGLVLEGESAVDEAPVTGESLPKPKRPDDQVYAGTINTDAVLRVKVTAAAEDNTIARVVQLVEQAQDRKAPTERFMDRFARVYTPTILLLAAAVALLPPLLAGADWSEWIYKGLAVLLIGCPCALVISTPAAIAAGLAAGARRGLLLKGGAVLEGLRKVTTVAFDKTGTLTNGRPVVTDVEGFGQPADTVLTLAAALEAGSGHPLARAILNRAGSITLPSVSNGAAVAGKGVQGRINGQSVALLSPAAASEQAGLSAVQTARIAALNAEGKTVSVLLTEGRAAGLIALHDTPRADATAALRALEQGGITTLMLTGDTAQAAAAIGDMLGISVHAGLLPAQKQALVEALQARGAVVAKVGDGINDAPALAAADFGIAMGGGADVALETADAAILHARLQDVVDMIALSKRVMRNIAQNIALALGLKLVLLVTTLAGLTGLWPAILADTGATVLVTLNALRLLMTRFPARL